jgi:ribosome maturation protein Sdo1
MARLWEIRGLFGNEYAMEQAVEELKKYKGLEPVVLDRRNLSVRIAERDEETEGIVKRTFEIHHGYVESEAPLGEYDARRQAMMQKKIRETEKRRKTRG